MYQYISITKFYYYEFLSFYQFNTGNFQHILPERAGDKFDSQNTSSAISECNLVNKPTH